VQIISKTKLKALPNKKKRKPKVFKKPRYQEIKEMNSNNFRLSKHYSNGNINEMMPRKEYNPFKKDLSSIPSFDCLLPPDFPGERVFTQNDSCSLDSIEE